MKKHGMMMIVVSILSIGAVGCWYYYAHQHNYLPSLLTQVLPVVRAAKSSEISLSPLTICKALDTAVEYLKISPDQLHPINNEQQEFLSTDYVTYRQWLTNDMFAAHELKAYVSDNAATLNKILRDNGFSIQLQEFANAQSIGVVAIQNIIVKWTEKAEQTSIQSGKQKYPGFSLDEHKMNVSFYAPSQQNDTDPNIVVAEIRTQSEDKVYCAVKITVNNNRTTVEPFFDNNAAVTDRHIMHTIDLLRSAVQDLSQRHTTDRYNALELPMITYREQPSLAWLLNLELHGHVVGQALQEVIFKMNDTGAQAKAAVAIELLRSMAPSSDHKPVKEPLIVNQPFLLWIERPGMPLPIFAAYLQHKYWSNPGSFADEISGS